MHNRLFWTLCYRISLSRILEVEVQLQHVRYKTKIYRISLYSPSTEIGMVLHYEITHIFSMQCIRTECNYVRPAYSNLTLLLDRGSARNQCKCKRNSNARKNSVLLLLSCIRKFVQASSVLSTAAAVVVYIQRSH